MNAFIDADIALEHALGAVDAVAKERGSSEQRRLDARCAMRRHEDHGCIATMVADRILEAV